MSDLQGLLAARIDAVAADRHVMLRGPAGRPFPVGDADSIVSGVPDLRIDPGEGRFGGRRRRLVLGDARGSLNLLARTRPLPDRPPRHRVHTALATDRRGRRVPVCTVDREHGTVHWLLDVKTAQALDRPVEEAAAPLARVLFVRPLDALLEAAPEPAVGAHVRHRVAAMLLEQRELARRVLAREMGMLRQLREAGRRPRVVRCRMERTQGMLDRMERGAVQACDEEAGRLRRLVSSRACAALRLGPRRITGLLNPRRVEKRVTLRALLFRLQLDARGRASLEFWDPSVPEPPEHARECLGTAEPILSEQGGDGDLFGIVDTVLSFTESNPVGLHGWRRPGAVRRLCGMLTDLF